MVAVKPRVALGDLNGPEGNIFCIVMRCRLAATRANWPNDRWREYLERLTSLKRYDDVRFIKETFDVVPPLVLACDDGEFDSKLPQVDESDPDWIVKRQARARDIRRLEKEFKERAREWIALVIPHRIAFEQVYAQAWHRAGDSPENFSYPMIIRELLSLATFSNFN